MITSPRHLWTIGKEVVLPLATFGLFVLSTNWAAQALADTGRIWRTGNLGTFDPPRALVILLFVVTLVALYRQRYAFFRPRTRNLRREYVTPRNKRKHLVLFLSDLWSGGSYVDGIPEGLPLTGDLEADLKAMIEYKRRTNQRWAWEMGLRGIHAHLGELKSVTVACSTKTISVAGQFLAILGRYRVLDGIELRVLHQGGDQPASEFKSLPPGSVQGLDFEDFDELSDSLWLFLKRHDYPDEDVMIDFTGGQKVASVVATALTCNRRIKAQYVQTNDPWKAVSYDAVQASSNTGGP